MYARLSAAYGWTREWPDGAPGPFILGGVERYAGMLGGTGKDGKQYARPIFEFDALSLDGEEWRPTAHLLALVPWEKEHVQIRDLSLPMALDKDQDGLL